VDRHYQQQQQQQQAAACTSSHTSHFCMPHPLPTPLLQTPLHAVLWAQMQLLAATMQPMLLQLLLLLNLGQAAQQVEALPADTLLLLLLLQRWVQMQQSKRLAALQLPLKGRLRLKVKKKMMMLTSCVWYAGSSSAAWPSCMEATHTW
jgi:hypothetical protein